MSTAFNIVQPDGSEAASEQEAGIPRVSEEREPPVQVLHSGYAKPPPGEAENRTQSPLEDLTESGNERLEPLLFIPRRPPRTATFKALQMYEGTIQEVRGGGFVANLVDKSLPDAPEQVATIDLDHVWESDLELVAPGAVFYWSVGYLTEPHGQRSIVSNIRFRRLPAWTRSDIKKAKEYAAGLDDLFASD